MIKLMLGISLNPFGTTAPPSPRDKYFVYFYNSMWILNSWKIHHLHLYVIVAIRSNTMLANKVIIPVPISAHIMTKVGDKVSEWIKAVVATHTVAGSNLGLKRHFYSGSDCV